jgi:uncharacterized protein (DUF305 family)
MNKSNRLITAIIMAGAICSVIGWGILFAQGKEQSVHPSTQEYIKANTTMHHGMNIKYTGDADLDFVKGMIPHHQGAIDMAKIQLKYGRDEQLIKLSRSIIEAQQKEIKIMQEWLELHE